MTTAYTSLLGLALPVTGELSGTWGDTVNTAITALLDSAVAGTTTISSDADVTLTTTTGAANTSREAILLWTAGGTVTRNITAPAQSKMYVVINASSSTQSIVLRGAGPTAGVTLIKGEAAVCAWNGTDFIKVANISGAGVFTSLTVSGTTTLSGLTASTALALDASKNVVSVTNTGSGNNVLATSPTLVTPALGTPSSGILTNATGLPISTGVSGLGTNVATFLATPTSANLASAVTDETGSGSLVFATSPTLVTPALGTPASGVVTNLTGTASININGTVGATTPAVATVTTLTATADSAFTSTGAVTLSKGTTAQQPASPVTGMLRYNSTTNQFEGYAGASPAWASVGGATLSNDTSTSTNIYPLSASATSGTALTVYTSNAKFLYKPSTGELQASEVTASNGLLLNATTVAASYTIGTGYNAMSVGPVTVASGQSVTVSSGQRWLVF